MGEVAAVRNGARVTIADVAARAAVSATTVSHVLSGKRLVGNATRERVREAIQELGYRPNRAARQLRTNTSRMVAVIVPDITNNYYAVLTRGLADIVGGDAYGTYVCNTDGSLERELMFVQDVLDRGVDGIVMASVNVVAEHERAPARFGTPLVCIGERLPDEGVDLVKGDDELGSYAGVTHLIERGAQRIAIIQGPAEAGAERGSGYRKALRDAGQRVDQSLMVRGDWSRPGGRAAMHSLMEREPRPDAVFCANDLTAIGAMDAARELGIAVPDEVAVVGFDDVDAATIVTPPLTTVRNPAYEAGCEAGHLLLSRMLGQYDGTGRTVVVPCPLVVRASS